MTKSPSPLMSLDIEDIVKEAKDEEISPQSSGEQASIESSAPQWESFLRYLQEFRERKQSSSYRKRAYYIEDNIVELINSCNIDGNNATNIINSALLAFIENHKQQFREHLKPSPTLIS